MIFMFVRGEQVQVDNATRAVHTRAAACITAEDRVLENVLIHICRVSNNVEGIQFFQCTIQYHFSQ